MVAIFVRSQSVNWSVVDKCHYIDGLVQDCSNSIGNALELLQSRTKPCALYQYIHQNFANSEK